MTLPRWLAIAELAADVERRKALGQAARRFAETRLERDLVLARYERRLHELTGRWLPAPAPRPQLAATSAMRHANSGLASSASLPARALRP